MRVYRASELGSCMRGQVAKQLGYQALATPDVVQGWFDRGNEHEEECIGTMSADGWDIDEQQAEIILNVAGAQVIGHLDGTCNAHEAWRVLEIKSPNSWAKWEKAHKTGDYSDPLMNRYAWQISAYMLGTGGLEAVVACVEEGRVKTFGIEVPPHSLAEIEGRVAFMEELVELGKLPSLCSQKDWPCPVGYLCAHEDGRVVDPEIDRLVREREALRVRIRADQAALKDLDQVVLVELGERESVETESSKVTRYETRRGTIKAEKLEAAGLDPEDFKEYNVTESVRITLRGE